MLISNTRNVKIFFIIHASNKATKSPCRIKNLLSQIYQFRGFLIIVFEQVFKALLFKISKLVDIKKILFLRPISGEMAEWSNAVVLKTIEGHTSGGSNPSLSAKYFI